METEFRITELVNRILRYQKSYYTGEAEVTDAEFDALWDELKILDPDNPVLKKIGSDADEGVSTSGVTYEKKRHLIPMGSQEKAANPAEFEEWAAKRDFNEFVVEYKLDGASLELQYENGTFLCAVTRGDGIIGDDISANVVKMQGFIPRLKEPLTGGVRGEVIMSRNIHKSFYADKANCRNAANGLMKRKDGKGSEHLQIICYDARFSNGSPFDDEEKKIAWLSDQGFETVHLKLCTNSAEVIAYREQVSDLRPSLPYDIDGLVVKGRDIDLRDAERARPEKQIAFKFNLEEAVSIVRSVIWSESGATYTPIAEFDAVELAGTRVKRASLVNPNTIRVLGVKIGSRVVVTKRGEIIPKIERLADSEGFEQSEIVFPSVCSVCGSALTDEGTRLFCPNTLCSKRLHHRIEKWVSVLDIRDFGINLIRRLYETKRLNSVSDIYTLTEAELAELDRLGEKSAAKIISSIKSRTTVSLARFIAGFDIEGIGETLAEKLVEAGFNTLEKLLAAREEEIASVYGFAEITARTLVQGLAECRQEMLFLTERGIITIEKPLSGEAAFLTGKSFCFTGELSSMKRSEAEKLVKAAGGDVKSAVVKGLSYLVTNDPLSGSSKNKKAAAQGTPIIDEREFLNLVKRDV
ncbi:NAD-dependent DNA ligase LigA [Treponema sp. OMZ 840]|uniref:NAD-dependent DNA ligase LigA n=1 Tax=Treponema sp. OMZ 840 TaxID=244313 RepID=UPI003D8C90F7